jgi:hypothetical protein
MRIDQLKWIAVTALGLAALGPISWAGTSASAKKTSVSREMDSIQEAMPQYLRIQDALTGESLNDAKSAAQELSSSKGISTETRQAALKLARAADIKTARQDFKALSRPFVAWVEKKKPADLEAVYCPMAGAKWVQKKGQIQNPYLGHEMLSCGEKT